jgi:OsmC-like protein
VPHGREGPLSPAQLHPGLAPSTRRGGRAGGLLSEISTPNASEPLLAALGSCLTLGIHANAVAQRIPFRRLELEVEADINTTAVWGTGDSDPKPIGFEVVRVVVHMDAGNENAVTDRDRDRRSALDVAASSWRRQRRRGSSRLTGWWARLGCQPLLNYP